MGWTSKDMIFRSMKEKIRATLYKKLFQPCASHQGSNGVLWSGVAVAGGAEECGDAGEFDASVDAPCDLDSSSFSISCSMLRTSMDCSVNRRISKTSSAFAAPLLAASSNSAPI